MTMRKDSYTLTPDDFPKGYTVKQELDHYDEQKYLFITEALNTPYEKVTQELKDTWHSLGLRMAMPNTGIGRSMQDDIKIHQAKNEWRNGQAPEQLLSQFLLRLRLQEQNEQAIKAHQLNETVRSWWGNTRTIIKTFMRV